jgi:hypothetical protein
MGVEYISANMTAGELTSELHARTDIEKYGNGLAEAKNMIILPFGGLRRRPGLSKVEDTYLGSVAARTFPFVFNTEQDYLLVMRAGFIDVYKDGAVVATVSSPYTAELVIEEVQMIQSADTAIFVHSNYAPRMLQRQGSDTAWDFDLLQFDETPKKLFDETIIDDYANTGLPQTINIRIDKIILNIDGNATNGLDHSYYRAKTDRDSIDLSTDDFTNTTNWEFLATKEDAWSDTRGWPATATFFGNRLWLAGTTQLPTTIWGSKINGFFDFGLGDGESDMGIEDTLDTDQYNAINFIFAGRALQVFTAGGEFQNQASPITPETSAWSRQTGYGGNTKNIRPVLIDGSTLFLDSSNRTVRQFVYSFEEDGMTSINASLLSSHLITDAIAMDAIKGTKYDVGDYVYVINEDGTVAVLNTMRHENIQGWTHWETDGNFVDVCVLNKEVYFIVERGGSYFLELLTEGTYTDHNVRVESSAPTVSEVVSGVDDVVSGFYNVVHTSPGSGVEITSVDTNFLAPLNSYIFKVIADYSILEDVVPGGTSGSNTVAIADQAYEVEVGLNFETLIRSLPLATETRSGTTIHRRKRVVKVDINVLNSLGIYARDRFAGDREFNVVLDSSAEPYTGFKEMYLLGYNRLAEIEISQKQPLPFTLRGIGYEIEY